MLTQLLFPSGTVGVAWRWRSDVYDAGDQVLAYLTGHDIFVLIDIGQRFAGFTGEQGVVRILGRKPFVRHDTYVQGWDAFGNLVSTIGHFLTDWDFTTQLVPSSEHPVTHYNMVGTLMPDPNATLYYPYGLKAYYGLTVGVDEHNNGTVEPSAFDFVGSLASAGEFPSSMDGNTFAGVSYDYSRFLSAGNCFQYLKKMTWFDGTWFNKRWEVVRLDLRFTETGLLPSGSWTFDEILGESFGQVSVWIPYQTKFLPGFEPPEPEGLWYPTLSEDSEAFYVSRFRPEAMTVLSSLPGAIGDRITPLVRGELDASRDFASFCVQAARLQRDSYAACFLSSNSALDSMITKFSSNHIEFLAELRDVIPHVDIVRALQALKGMKKKPVRALVALLQLLSNVKLVYSFGIAPTLRDAEDVSRKAASTMQKLLGSSTYQEQTIKGKFSFDIPDEYCGAFPGIHLSARSSIRIRIDEDSLLASILPTYALGLLPSVSNLWDIVPWSFLVDWFFPVGEVTSQLETSTLMMLAKTSYSTHSINLAWCFPDDYLTEYGLGNASGTDSCFRLYDRFVLSHLPTAAPTNLPIYGGLGVPDWSLLGALLFTRVSR